ncbi:hypothetical protein [Methylotuvimicrobium sp. KM1]|uniref:hypothetical protein n=1 Tax=Methylotuvimicrobium sp. KM1 TaxID=3377707 RepID=UPI0038510B01
MPLAYQEHYTVDDYQQWEGNWELIEGMPYTMTPSPSVTHQIVAFNIVTSIKNALKTRKPTVPIDVLSCWKPIGK